MRHRKRGRKLSRNSTHRLALFRNLSLALFRHERIITTEEKAKELRPFVEKLITIAKRGLASENNIQLLHARRLILSRLGGPAIAAVQPDEDQGDVDSTRIIVKLFDEIAPRYKDRAGGYTRVIKRSERRLGDAGKTAFIELLKAGEVKVQTRAPVPAPKVEDEEEDEDQGEEETSEADNETSEETPPTEGEKKE